MPSAFLRVVHIRVGYGPSGIKKKRKKKKEGSKYFHITEYSELRGTQMIIKSNS